MKSPLFWPAGQQNNTFKPLKYKLNISKAPFSCIQESSADSQTAPRQFIKKNAETGL